MKYRLPRKLKKAVKRCFIISDIETNVTLSSVRTVGNIAYIGRHTKYTHKAIKWLRQREYNKVSEWLTKSLKDLYANDIEKKDLHFNENMYDWGVLIQKGNINE